MVGAIILLVLVLVVWRRFYHAARIQDAKERKAFPELDRSLVREMAAVSKKLEGLYHRSPLRKR